MKRLAPILLALAFLAPASPAEGAAQQMMSCGMSTKGWELWRGAGASLPNTRCVFVRATYRKVKRLQQRGKLRYRFRLRVRGKGLRCQVKERPHPEITCRSRVRFARFIYW